MATGRHRLRARREELGLTQEEVAERLGVNDRTYRRCEEGQTTLRVGQRPKLAQILGWSTTQLAAALRDEDPSGAFNGHEVPTWLGHLASLEQGASRIDAYEPIVVNGLLQTRDYAAAVESADPIPKSDEDIAERVQLRLARQAVLDRKPTPVELAVVLDESVLHRVAGDADVMADQLEHLATMAHRPNIELRVLPLDAGVFSTAFGAFKVLTSPGSSAPYMACVEDRAGPHYMDRQPEVDAHTALFEHVRDMALAPVDSIDLIRTVHKESYQ